jgi:hypothetical protein
MLEPCKSGGIKILDDSLTLKDKTSTTSSLIEKMHKKWLQIMKSLNLQDGNVYSKNGREKMENKGGKCIILLEFLEIHFHGSKNNSFSILIIYLLC